MPFTEVPVTVPGGTARCASRTPRGAVALAWFAGDPTAVTRLAEPGCASGA
ncbi:hypothetical protein [Yinghuangia soli]|uniref:Uncharacterized protein n=1 Tax=Yinghuangia soli TaxID=2908204 RepID=A0AA41TYS9_9ACTN|nr:hypothetical protein [Yinghuangia soli]MCF2526500.1 hypothetical protein [Yinghuangia soli]